MQPSQCAGTRARAPAAYLDYTARALAFDKAVRRGDVRWDDEQRHRRVPDRQPIHEERQAIAASARDHKLDDVSPV